MSPRLDENAVVKRQIMEGVLAIIRLNTAALAKGKIGVQIFDRKNGINNVEFKEYADLDLTTAAALVNDAKQRAAIQPVQQPAYGQTYGAPPPANPYAVPAPANTANPANLSSIISSLDPNSLSQLLGVISGNNAAQTPQAPHSGLTPDLARLLSSVTSSPAAPAYNAPAQPQQQFASLYQNPAFASLMGGQQPQQNTPSVQTPQAAPGQPPDMAEIMAQLAKYQR